MPPPDRTLTFLWVDEIRGSQQWITSHPDEAKGVRYMFSMDMTGEDTAKTGGTFLIEKQADPSAVWDRGRRTRTASGAAGGVKAETLKGSLLNDLHLAVARRRARDTGWIVRTNPYEGGSDHTVFADRGVPVAAQLALHRSLLPHQPGHHRQGQRRGDGERRHHRRDVRLCAGLSAAPRTRWR